MGFQARHAILPEQSHDEFARESFAATMRRYFTEDLFPKNATLYHGLLKPTFEKAHGRPPRTRLEVKELMNGTFFYRASSLLGRATQELLWDLVGESIERQTDRLKSKLPAEKALGSLTIKPGVKIPDYIEAVDIHAMPGNFHTELCIDDIMAGALYDRGVFVFAYGGLGPNNDALGQMMAGFIKDKFPDMNPRRILDMGCGTGFSTLPLKEAFPEAEVYGIDIGAPMVRYAHARAESMGVPIHFSQQDATCTDFPDGHFDLITSMIVHHECPRDVIAGMVREGHRLLASGGIMVHDGARRPEDVDPFARFLSDWFTHNVNEPFSNHQGEMDFDQACRDAGFSTEDLFTGERETPYLKGQLPPFKFRGAVKR
jgi:SAM-dependent methyltransferase